IEAAMESNDSQVILLGTLEAAYSLRALAFSLLLLIFVITILSSLLVLGTVTVSTELHRPMYAFMCNLILVDIIGCTASLPQQLGIFLTGDKRISRASCIAQMFWINVFAIVESLTLTAMIILTTVWVIAVAELLPLTILVMQLTLKEANRDMPGIFCDYIGFARLSINDTRVQETYSSVMMAVLFGLPLCLIAYTYVMILYEFKRTQLSDSKTKALHTFLTHVFLLAAFFIAVFITILVPRIVKDFQTVQARNIRCLSQIITFFVPIANITIYFFRTKELRKEATMCFKKVVTAVSGSSRH
uniref:G-protein coupled receptors family 1 profile domain-containing protein n=1 Tax=Petromyzon marinus TaxID=7757 RepID=S4RWG1_PETMA